MFFDIYDELCSSRGKSPTAVAIELGISRAAVSAWRNSSRTPRPEQLQKIAEYFGVSVDYLLGAEIKKESAADESDELAEYLEELKNRSEMRMLFSLAAGATKEDVEKAVRIIEALRDPNHEE